MRRTSSTSRSAADSEATARERRSAEHHAWTTYGSPPQGNCVRNCCLGIRCEEARSGRYAHHILEKLTPAAPCLGACARRIGADGVRFSGNHTTTTWVCPRPRDGNRRGEELRLDMKTGSRSGRSSATSSLTARPMPIRTTSPLRAPRLCGPLARMGQRVRCRRR